MLTQYEIKKIAEATAKETVREMGNRDELLNVKQVADMLGLSICAIHTRCSRGKIPCHRRHGTLYFSKNEVTEYYLNDKDIACCETR